MKLTRRKFLAGMGISLAAPSVIPQVFPRDAEANYVHIGSTTVCALPDGLAEELKLTADNIVGRVGECQQEGSKTRYSITGEEFLEVAFVFHNENDIIEKWVNFIKGYTVMAQNVFHGSVDATKLKPSIYWSTVPEIITREKLVYMRDGYLLYACLLISNKGDK